MLKIKKPFTLITTSDGDLGEAKIIDIVSEDTWEVLKQTPDYCCSILIGFPEDYEKPLEDWSLEDSQDYFGIYDEEEKYLFDRLKKDHKWFDDIFEWVD